MIIFLSELQKQHLNLLHEHSIPVLVDFCKLTIESINNGYNWKKNNVAAEKLGITSEDVQNIIQALAYLITEACNHNLSEANFNSSLAIAGFSPDQQQILLKLYLTKKAEISESLRYYYQQDAAYHDLRWRFEIQVASKNIPVEVNPMVTMDFILTTPKKVGDLKDDANPNHMSEIYLNSSIQEATAASQCQNIINHVLLQCDLPNLLHMTNKLDEALKESKSQHVRKIQRSL